LPVFRRQHHTIIESNVKRTATTTTKGKQMGTESTIPRRKPTTAPDVANCGQRIN